MTIGRAQIFNQSLILLATIPTVVPLNLDRYALGSFIGFYLSLHNTGANPINTILWERSAIGDEYVTDLGYASAAGTSLAAGVKVSLEDSGISSQFLQITLTSTLGTTCELRGRVTEP